MPACFVNGCRKTSRTSNLHKDGITFHLFPHNLLQRRKWTEACNRAKDWIPTSSSSICSRHFEVSQFNLTENNRRQLKKNATPTLLLNKHELDKANLNNNTSSMQVIPRVISKPHVSTTLHKNKVPAGDWFSQTEKATSTIPETNSNKEGLKKDGDIQPVEYLQMFIKQLMPNIKDSDAIYVVLVNNEKSEPGSDTLSKNNSLAGTNYATNVKHQFESVYLRRKLAKKTELAEKRLKELRRIRESRRRLMKKNAKLMEMIEEQRAENYSQTIVSQLTADPIMVSHLDLNDMRSDSESELRTDNEDDEDGDDGDGGDM